MQRSEQVRQQLVRVPAGGVELVGYLYIPEQARGIVLVVHGSGSNRHSPRNQLVAERLNGGGLATLLIDLLAQDEEATAFQQSDQHFNVETLSERIVDITDWLAQENSTAALRLCYYGVSTGAGAALLAAAERPDAVAAMVARGGRTDLAARVLARIRTPTLLIVGGNDFPIISANREALSQLGGERGLEVVPGATHLFEEPGALDQVAQLAQEWFLRHLPTENDETRA